MDGRARSYLSFHGSTATSDALGPDLITGAVGFRTGRGDRRWRRVRARRLIINVSRRPPDIIFTPLPRSAHGRRSKAQIHKSIRRTV